MACISQGQGVLYPADGLVLISPSRLHFTMCRRGVAGWDKKFGTRNLCKSARADLKGMQYTMCRSSWGAPVTRICNQAWCGLSWCLGLFPTCTTWKCGKSTPGVLHQGYSEPHLLYPDTPPPLPCALLTRTPLPSTSPPPLPTHTRTPPPPSSCGYVYGLCRHLELRGAVWHSTTQQSSLCGPGRH